MRQSHLNRIDMELINQILPQIKSLQIQCIDIEFGVKREEVVGVEIQVLSSLLGWPRTLLYVRMQ